MSGDLFLTALIIVLSLIYGQYAHYRFVERQKVLDKTIHASGELEKLQKEFTEYKKRVDALTLKAGFKL